jgi:hypothetical protein
MKTYKNKINQLLHNQVFVFGSNPVGIQGKGSALFALKRGWCQRNERINNCLSKCGKSWGLVTIAYPGKKKSKTLDEIKSNIQKLYQHATQNPDKEFLIAYTGIKNYNLNGYTNQQLADCFNQKPIPNNIVFEEEFITLIEPNFGKGFTI